MSTTSEYHGSALRRRAMIGISDVIMDKDSNPKLLAIMYSKGYCKHPDYMTAKEAKKVTSVTSLFGNLTSANTCPPSFDEFRFFTKISNTAAATRNIGYYASYLRQITFPEHLTVLGNAVVGGRANTAQPRVIIGSKVTSIGTYFFYSCPTNGDNQRVVICKAVTPPTVSSSNTRMANIDMLYVPDNSVDAYSEHSMWSQVGSILPISQCPREYGEYQGLIKGNALDD